MNADPLAASYRWLEYAAFGRALERCRFDFLSRAVTARRVLILGEGDGRFLTRLVECNRHAEIVAIDSSARMLDLARRRISSGAHERVAFHQLDALASPLPAGAFDLAVTQFFLDCFDWGGVAAIISKVNAVLKPGALWLVGEFQTPEHGWRRIHAQLWLNTMYRFFGVTTGLRTSALPDYRALLIASGFAELERRERRNGLIVSQVWRKET